MHRSFCRRRRRAAFLRVSMLAAALVSGALPVAHADGGGSRLCVTVSDVRNGHGHIRLAVCTPQTFLGTHCPISASSPARIGSVTLCVDDVTPGVYAIQAFHDEDDSGRIKLSMLGIPEEGVGFSNDASARFGAPRFADAAFTLTADGSQLHLRLQHFD